MFYDLKRTIISTVNDMHISMWTDSYYPYISGVTRSIKLTKDTLTRMGHSVSVFCPSYPEADQEPNVYRFPSIKSPTKPDYYIAVPVNPKHLMAIKELAPDVIHAHSPFNLGKMGITVGTILDIPTVFTFHTMYNMYSHYVPLIGNSIAELIEFGAIGTAKSVDAVIAPSSAIRDYLRDHGVTTDIFVIPTGIEIDQFLNGDASYIRETYGVPDDLPILLTCGRLGREKNPECLLRAFSIIRKSLDSVLVMVGDGPLREELEQLAEELNVADRVIFSGKVNPDLMPHFYASADLFMFSSLTDTQGLVIAEAKAAGLPCVAVGALGVKDMVAHNVDGFLCDNDPSCLAQKALLLLENPSLMDTMRTNALCNAHNFSIEKTCARLVECYETVRNVSLAAR